MSDLGILLGIPLVIAGAILLFVEIIHPGAFLLIPGTILFVAGVLFIVVPSLITESIFGPAIVALAALGATLATFPYYRRIAPIHRPMTTIPMSLEGQTGIVVAAVEPDNLKGKVRVNSEIWSARADQHIPAGTKVRVLGGEGVSVRVEPLPASAPN